MYYIGEGVPQDYAEAVKWYRLAADQGEASAQSDLGFMYAYGTGVPQDYAEAVKWYRLAAAQGEADAQYNLGLMYCKGQGVPQDYAGSHEVVPPSRRPGRGQCPIRPWVYVYLRRRSSPRLSRSSEVVAPSR